MDQHIVQLRIETVRGNLEGVKTALTQGISVDQSFQKGEWNALMHASSLGHHEIVKYLLQEDADPNFHKELFTPLMAACASNVDNEERLLRCVQHLILHNAHVNAVERHRLTPLMFACKQGHARIVRHLLANNAELDAQDSQGWTALFWAVTKGQLKIVEILLIAGANKEERDRSGGTALLLAARQGFHQIAEILRYGIIKHSLDQNETGHNFEDDDLSSFSDNSDKNRDSQRSDCSETTSKCFPLNDSDYTKLGLKYSRLRRDTLELIKELQLKPWKKADNPEGDAITYVTAVKILAEFASQMSDMHAALSFIRYRFQHFPLATPQDKRWTSSTRLRSVAGLAHCKSEILCMEAKYFSEYLTKLDETELAPSEVRVEKNMTRSEVTSGSSSILTSVVVATACIVVVLWNTKTIGLYWTFPVFTW